jgi:ribonuclease BN (tRNA processing enzyme)
MGLLAVALSLLGCARAPSRTPAAPDCRSARVAVQVLGSGGPIPEGARASASYLVWMGGKARALIDAGGGAMLRFGEAKARVEDLDVIAISHLHADHVADLIALLKAGYFADRSRPLPIVGPSAGAEFPAMDDFLRGHLDPERGTYRYLSGYLDGSGGLFAIQPIVADTSGSVASEVYRGDGLAVEAVGVHHGRIPALGFVVTAGDRRIAFTGDQSGDAPKFWERAAGANLLIAHHAIPESAGRGVQDLHATPSTLARLVAKARVGHVVLSHNMQRSLARRDEAMAILRRAHPGELTLAEDLQCFVLTP